MIFAILASIIISIIFLTVIIIFAFPQFSPIPYFPSNPKDLPLIIQALKLKNDHTIFDLGAGDGIIVFEAAKESYKLGLNTFFVAIEMNPILVAVLHIRRFFHPNKNQIKIILGDMFKLQYKQISPSPNSIGVYIYVSPRFIPRIISTMQNQFQRFYLVSYYYPIEPDMKPALQGVHAIFSKPY